MVSLRLISLLALGVSIGEPALSQPEFALPPGQTSYLPIRIGAEKGRLIQFLRARSRGPAPVVIMLDDWKKPGRRYAEATRGLSDMLRARGIAFALVPSDRFWKDGGEEVAQAMAVLRDRSADLQIDMDRMALIGEGWGASYAALVSLDPVRARAVGLDIGRISATVMLSGECYDISLCNELASERTRSQLLKALPADGEARRSLSPIRHAAKPNAASFYLHFEDRTNERIEGQAMAKALRDAGQSVVISSAALRFDQASVDRLDKERPNANSGTLIDYLAARLVRK